MFDATPGLLLFSGGQGTHPDPPESLPLTKKWAFWEQKVVPRPDCIDRHLDQLDQSMQWGLKTSPLSPSPHPPSPETPMCRGQVPDSGARQDGWDKDQGPAAGPPGVQSYPLCLWLWSWGLSFPICKGEQIIGPTS